MYSWISALRRLAAGVTLALCVANPVLAADPEAALARTIEQVENRLDADVGVMIRDSGSDWQWGHRIDERVLMNSTVKTLICAAVLGQVDQGSLSLADKVDIAQADILEYAPVTEKQVGSAMSLDDLCLAAIDMSDNTAANLLMRQLGGPQAVTAFLRGIGDQTTRTDRYEPELNTYKPGDPRDTTTPAAMADALQALLVGDALSPESRAHLIGWMTPGSVTGKLLRATTPQNWHVADKSGSGRFNRNIAGIVTPAGRAPYVVAVFLSGADADLATRDAAVAEISAAIIGVLKAR